MKIIFRGLCAFTEWSSSDPQKQGCFTVLMPKSGMMNMPGMAMHHAALCVPVSAYTSSTGEPASIVPGGMVPSDAQWQPYGTPFAVWSLEGRELSILQDPPPTSPTVGKSQAVGYKALSFIPSLGDANGGDDRVDPKYVTGAPSSLTARVQLVGGGITALPPAHPVMTCEKWTFGSRANVAYTDQVLYETGAQNCKLVVSDLSGSTNVVQIDLNIGVTVFVTHLAQTPAKEHFKMYWSLLINPNAKLPVPENGQSTRDLHNIIGFTGLTSQYPGDCLGAYAHVDV